MILHTLPRSCILRCLDQSSRDFTQVVSKAVFDVSRLVEATRHQRLDPLPAGGSPERSDSRIPLRAELDIWRQAGVYEALGLSDRPFVELGDPGCKRPYECIQLGVGLCWVSSCAHLCGPGRSLKVVMGICSVLAATIQPEQNGGRNWTMVSPILSYLTAAPSRLRQTASLHPSGPENR